MGHGIVGKLGRGSFVVATVAEPVPTLEPLALAE